MSTETTDQTERVAPDPRQFRERADAGDAEAQYRMAVAYLARENPGRGRRWLQRAAEGGHGEAARKLGDMHLEGGDLPAAPAEAAKWYRRGAESGSPPAMRRLAELAFTGRGMPVDEGAARDWLLAAARADDPPALRQLGMVYARLAPDGEWQPRAHACLARAASLGDPVAMHACGVRLIEGRGVAADPEAGARWLARASAQGVYLSRQRIEPGAQHSAAGNAPPAVIESFQWPAPRETELERLAQDPPVHHVRGLADPETCDYLINVAAPYLVPARTVNPQTGEPERNELRTNSHAGIHGARLDIPIHMLERDMSHVARSPVNRAEQLAVLRYAVGEEYRPHFDYINPLAGKDGSDFRDHGQRVKTIFAYLNDVPAGGETEFPRLGVKVKPERGGGILFRNTRPEGTPDDATLHAGCPVTEGEKWLATLWIRERPLGYR